MDVNKIINQLVYFIDRSNTNFNAFGIQILDQEDRFNDTDYDEQGWLRCERVESLENMKLIIDVLTSKGVQYKFSSITKSAWIYVYTLKK